MDSYALPSGKHSMYKCDLKFSAQETISPIYLFNHLFIIVQTHISVVIQYCYLIFSKLFQLWPFGALSVAPISFWHALIGVCVCVSTLSYCPVLPDILHSFCIFFAVTLESVISRNPGLLLFESGIKKRSVCRMHHLVFIW